VTSYFNEIKFPKTNSLLRAILFWVVFIIILFLSSFQSRRLVPAEWWNLAYGIFGTVSALLVTWIFLRAEKRSFRNIGLVWERKTLYRFFKGLLVGTIIFIAIIVILLAFTGVTVEKNPKDLDLSGLFVYIAFIPLAFMEEIAFRAYPFLKLNKGIGLRATQLLAAIAFALYHIIGGWSVEAAFLGPATWAFVFGLSAIWSGGIAVPTGIHVALNVIQSLLGMKDDFPALWIMKYKESATAAAMERSEVVGIIIQLLVLTGGVLMTEYYIRKRWQKLPKQH
jgi:uncharacterized protein